MNDAQIAAAIDRLLENFRFNARREIEKAVRAAVASGQLKEGENPATQATLTCEKLALNVTIHKRLEL